MDHPEYYACSFIEHSIGLKRIKIFQRQNIIMISIFNPSSNNIVIQVALLLYTPEPSLLAYTKYGCRRRPRPAFTPLTLLDTSVCAFINKELAHMRYHALLYVNIILNVHVFGKRTLT